MYDYFQNGDEIYFISNDTHYMRTPHGTIAISVHQYVKAWLRHKEETKQ